MENQDVLVLRTLLGWRRAGHGAALVTVTRTWGSSPRPVGSIMAMRDDGAVVGSVSGGCVEDDLILRYTAVGAAALPGAAPRLLQYGVSADEAHRFGLPCGGTLEMLLEPDPDADSTERLVTQLDRGQLVQRRVSLEDGTVSLQASQAPAELKMDALSLTATFGPEYRLLLIGGGQLTEYLATMAQFNGFQVTVCDPRDEHLRLWSVPGVSLSAEMPDDAVIGFHPDRRSGVIALTHDPKLDDLALLEALGSEAFYVGGIGSRRNSDARRQRLKEHFDADDAMLARLRGPIGMYIGSKTPSEIAVSVMAEIIAARNGIAIQAEQTVAGAKGRQVPSLLGRSDPP